MSSPVSILVVLLLIGPPIGSVRFSTSSPSTEAQARFLSGLAWLHSFGYDEAIAEFRKAQGLDPGLAMAYWGEALCHYRPVWRMEDVGAGRAALAKLGPTAEARRAKLKTARERAYFSAVETVFGPTADRAVRHQAFADAMGRIVAQYPDDADAAALQAFALIGMIPPGMYANPAFDRAGAIAERAFARQPSHPGAAHAVIHAYDDRDRASRALQAARAYAKLAPASSHAHHMPAHIFMQLGMWNEAAASDQAAWDVTVAHVKRHGLKPADLDFHPLSWLVYEYLQQGRFDRARGALRPLEEALAGDPKPWMKNELATWRAYYIVGSARWAEVATRQGFDNADELFALGYAAAKSNDLGKATATLDVMKKVAATEKEPSRRALAAIMERQLTAATSAAAGAMAPALAAAGAAAALEDKTPRATGRPHPVKSSHELWGELLLVAKRPAEAKTQFERALWRMPNRSSSLLGLARAASAAGDRAYARTHYQAFLRNWSAADPGRPELAEARLATR